VPPDFSVIIPTRGDSSHLRDAMRSALDGAESRELLVVHDRRLGEDALPAELASDSRVRLLGSDRPGPAAARNAGLEAATGRWVALLDDDDLWLPQHLAWCRECLERHPDAVLVATGAFLLSDRSPDGGMAPPSDPSSLPRFEPGVAGETVVPREIFRANPILTPTVVLVRDRLGPDDRFSSDLRVMEDYDLWLRLARRHPIVFDARPSVIVRRRPGSASRDRRAMAEEALEVLARAVERGIPPGALGPRELRVRQGRLWHDLAYACLAADDLPSARRALGESISRLPLFPKNYMYVLAGVLPGRLRRRWFARAERSAVAPVGGGPSPRRERSATPNRP